MPRPDATAREASSPDELFPLVYTELRAVAGAYFRGERSDHTLQPTALVHDAYMKIARQPKLDVRGREHFMAIAARAMRQILINHARDRHAAKRGGGAARITLIDVAGERPREDVDPIELDEALTRLERLDPRQCRIVELRYFTGLSVEETARVLEVSEPTVKRDWKMARAWLLRELRGDEPT